MDAEVRKRDDVILNTLKERFQDNIYYTWAADVLLILRPPDDDVIKSCPNRPYPHELLDGKNGKNSHVHSFSKSIYDAVMTEPDDDLCDQTVIMRGISGSGKTEASKELVNNWFQFHSNDDSLKLKINDLFSVIEAFGNASTSSNRNSSRCAFTHTLYFQANQVVGINLTQLLFDPWRLVDQSEESSNFHVFYYVLAGFQDNQESNIYRLLRNQSTIGQEDFNYYRHKYRSLMDALKMLGFSAQEQRDTMLLLMMILTLGNVTFRRSKFGDVALEEESKNYLKSAAEMVGLDEDDLEKCLLHKINSVSNEEIVQNYTRDEAEDFLAFLLWSIYNKLFTWLVKSINGRLSPIGQLNKFKHVHVIDFPGSEMSKVNSLEEFMINVSDDILHYSFVQNYCSLLKEDYIEDGLEWIPENLNCNSELAKMFLLPGLLIDSISITLKEDKSLISAESMTTNLSPEHKKYIHIDSKRPNLLVITHYDNEKASYDLRGWPEKNKIKLPANVIKLLKHSENPLLSLLMKAKFNFQSYQQVPRTPELMIGRPQPIERYNSATSYFKKSLTEFLKLNTQTTISFICCIKSSPSSTSKYDFDFVRKQFEGMGLKDLVYNFKNIHQHCFKFEDFLERYSSLTTTSSSSSSSSKEQCMDILKVHLPDHNWKIGKSKIFVQQHHLTHLNKVMNGPNLKDIQTVGSHCPVDDGTKCVYSKPNKHRLVNNMLQNNETLNPVIKSPKINLSKSTDEGLRLKRKSIKIARLLNESQLNDPAIRSKPTVTTKKDSDSDSESDFEVWNPSFKEKQYGEVGARKTSIKWFKTTQAKQLLQENGFYADWFHGIISRSQAENLLKNKSNGCFLIRVAESRLGYSMSFIYKHKFHHYMISEVAGGKFKITGEKAVHQSLKDLVEFYKKNKISNWNGYLTIPCIQAENECDYSDLLLSAKDIQEIRQAMARPRLEPTAPSH